MSFLTTVRLALYRHFVATGRPPTPEDLSGPVGAPADEIRRAYRELHEGRVIFLEPDRETIRMAAPFSGVPTPHLVRVGRVEYFANCAWDALGIPAALHQPAVVRSSCAESGEPLELEVGLGGPPSSSWVFHSLVPAARWWKDLVFT